MVQVQVMQGLRGSLGTGRAWQGHRAVQCPAVGVVQLQPVSFWEVDSVAAEGAEVAWESAPGSA